MHSFKKCLPLVAQGQCPVITLKGQVQLSPLPVWEIIFVHRHKPALRVAAPKRVDINSKDGLQGAILSQTNLQREAQYHMDQAGLVLVAL